jgi:hypothetical protein
VAERRTSNNGRSKSSGRAAKPVAERVNIFGDDEQAASPIFPGRISHDAVVALIERILATGGYISFAASSGGESVKLSFACTGLEGARWAYSEAQMEQMVAKVYAAVSPEPAEPGAPTKRK